MKQESDCPVEMVLRVRRATVGMFGCGGWRKRMEFGCAGVGAGAGEMSSSCCKARQERGDLIAIFAIASDEKGSGRGHLPQRWGSG